MPRPKPKAEGKRVIVWLPPKQLKTAKQIDNLSNFFQIALDCAADIMAWSMLKDYDPKTYNTGTELSDVKDKFNEQYPQNELTLKRTGKWPKNSPKKPELW